MPQTDKPTNKTTYQLPVRRPNGRPRVLTPEVCEVIARRIREGSHVITACRCAGISQPTFYTWRKRCVLNDPEAAHLAGFFSTVSMNEAALEAELLRIVRHGGKRWRAAARILERRFPSRWGRRSRRAEAMPPSPPRALAELTDVELDEYERNLDHFGARAGDRQRSGFRQVDDDGDGDGG